MGGTCRSNKQRQKFGQYRLIINTCSFLHNQIVALGKPFASSDTKLNMKTLGTVVLFIPLVCATKGFTYNDDVVCGYPFENFIIESISCAPSSYVHVWPEGGEPSNIYDSHDVCAFGNEMEIVGRVTVSQAVARIYHANLNACFRTSQTSWYSAKKCMLFKTSVDLRTYAVQAQAEDGEQSAAAVVASQTYYDYVEPGEFSFSARVVIPKKTFVFNAGTLDCMHNIACCFFLLPINTYNQYPEIRFLFRLYRDGGSVACTR